MVGVLLKLRWLAVVIAALSAIHAVAFIAIGAVRGFGGYQMLLQGPPWSGEHSPGVLLAKSIDAFLLAMVMFVFSIGITTLFLAREGHRELEVIPEWMRMKNLAELKFLIWEAILAALVVASVEGLIVTGQEIAWSGLIVPVATLVLAAGLFLARKAH